MFHMPFMSSVVILAGVLAAAMIVTLIGSKVFKYLHKRYYK